MPLQDAGEFVDLLRHGEVAGGACFRGERDDPLTVIGWEQMTQAMAEPVWSEIISSPSRRCADFARQLAATHGLPLRLLDAVRERGFGAWEGRTTDQIPLDDLMQFWNDPAGFTPPDAELFAVFRDRVLSVWRELCDNPTPRLLITHGGVIRVLIAEVLQMPDSALLLIEVPFANLTRLRLSEPPGRPSLVFHRSC